jgi:hypothetical protein
VGQFYSGANSMWAKCGQEDFATVRKPCEIVSVG